MARLPARECDPLRCASTTATRLQENRGPP
jgi:hypothetical protein